ncbi:hypothetical protein MTR67_036410 [Solanum verrucosum]|uniref:Uncharacterized protein n=1 Tax=Solanum verrucosum TaxID=315347 RepID=A0AAF0ZMK3_SOLVR|nr:hypothetical protein MTR67_036410 [Solanum verrucosum]
MNKITVRSSYSSLGLKIHAVRGSILKFGNLVVDHEYGSGQNIRIAENFFIFISFIKRKRCLCLPLCYHKSKPSFFSLLPQPNPQEEEEAAAARNRSL